MKFDTFTIAFIFITFSALIGAFLRRRRLDRCLKDFRDDPVTLEKLNGDLVKGNLKVESTGLEFLYSKKNIENNISVLSYIFYKYEYPQIQILIRYHDELSDEGKIERLKELNKTYRPTKFHRLGRKIRSIFKTVRDSINEVANLLIAFAQKTKTAGAVLTANKKYVSKMQQEIIESVGTAHEPLLENYIGHKVVFELIKGETISKYSGVLKNYTVNFIELMDVEYNSKTEEKLRIADIVIPQKFGIVRHRAE